MDSEKAKRIHPDTRLMQALNFTAEDVQANREGYMTKAQRARLKRTRFDGMAIMTGIAVFFFIIAVFLFPRAIVKMAWPGDLIFLIWLLWSPGLIIWLRLMRQAYARFSSDLHKGLVSVVEDVLSRQEPESKDSYFYELRLENECFYELEQVANGFFSFQRYRVYYAPHTRTILSAEWIDE